MMLAGDTDMAQLFQVIDNLVEPCFGIGCVIDIRHQSLNETARKPDHTLIFGRCARGSLQQEPCDVYDQTEHHDECQKCVQPCAQGEPLPHCHAPLRPLHSVISRRALTAKNSSYLIER